MTPLIGLIQDGDESAYRQEVEQLAIWSSLNNLELNTLKTVDMIVDFRRNPPALLHSPSYSTVTAVDSFRLLGTTISQDLKWVTQQRLNFLRQLRKFNLPQELLKQFYSATIESVNNWFSSATKSDLRRLWRVVRTAERIIGTILPTLQELHLSRVSKRAVKITLDPSHPAHFLFELLPSGRRYRALSTRTTRHRNSFFPQAILDKHLTLNVEHTLFIHILHFKCAHTSTYNCQFVYCYSLFYFYSFIICVFCPVTVILLHCGSFCHESRMCKHTWQ